MSILNFSNLLWARSIENSSQSLQLGSFTNSSTARQLGHIRVSMYFDGSFSTENITLKVTDSLSSPTFTYESNTLVVQNIDTELESNTKFLTWVRFDFDKQWIEASTEYFVYMDAANYTETDSLSISGVFDYPVPMIGSRLSFYYSHPIAMQIFGYERD